MVRELGRHRAGRWALLVLPLAAGCGAPDPIAGPPATTAAPEPSPPVASAAAFPASPAEPVKEATPGVQFLHDDLPAALALAKRENKLVFVDAWATWCHTCLSMKATVFREPSLAGFAEHVVFVALDTDKDENANFGERYQVSVLPTFFLVDPAGEELLGFWPGSASLGELRAFLQDGIDTRVARAKGGLPADSPVRLLSEARIAHNAGHAKKAVQKYKRSIERAPADWPRRSEAVKGWVRALANTGDVRECVRVGQAHLAQLQGASVPADVSAVLLQCAGRLKSRPGRRTVQQAVALNLERLLAAPPKLMAPDDVGDAWRILGDAYQALGRSADAQSATRSLLEVLEKAAAAAPDVHARATYDYGRAVAYVALGQHEKAERMLLGREKELPGSAEPPARLGTVYLQSGRFAEAVQAFDRALALAYGPRKMRYLGQKADAQLGLKQLDAAITTVAAQVRGYEVRFKGRAHGAGLERARTRLRALRKRAGK